MNGMCIIFLRREHEARCGKGKKKEDIHKNLFLFLPFCITI